MVWADVVVVNLRLACQAAEPEELDELTRSLYAELSDLDVENIDFLAGDPAPSHSKSTDPITLGALAIVVLPRLLPRLVEFLEHWTRLDRSRTIVVEVQRDGGALKLQLPVGVGTDQLKELLAAVKDSGLDQH